MKVPILLPNIFNHPFTYESKINLKVGDYVIVPFGKAKITGVVWNKFEKKKNKRFLTKQVLRKIHVPSLNNRRDDIPVLVNHFIEILAEDHRIDVPIIEKSALKMICEANWTGNVRELRNVIERLLILTPSGENISSKIVSKYSHFTKI